MISDKVPPTDGYQSTTNTLLSRYPADNGETIVNTSIVDNVKRVCELKQEEKDIKNRIAEQENIIKEAMQTAEKCICGDYEVTWKNQARTSLDTKRIKAEKPEIYEKFAKTSNIRVLKVKALK